MSLLILKNKALAPANLTSHLRCRTRCLRLLAPVLLGLVLCSAAQANLYLQDAVNYPASTQLGANAPWAGPYAQVTVASGSLLYPGLSDLSPAGNMIASVAATGGGASYRVLDTTATSGTVYLSFLLKCSTAPGTRLSWRMALPRHGGHRTLLAPGTLKA